VFGAVRGSPRLHWGLDGAKLEAQGWAEEMGTGPIAWARVENGIAVGRIKGTPSWCAAFCRRSDRRPSDRKLGNGVMGNGMGNGVRPHFRTFAFPQSPTPPAVSDPSRQSFELSTA